MNREAQEKLASLLALEPEALSDGDRAFLAARSDYLTDEQKDRYGLTGRATKANVQEAGVEQSAEAESTGEKPVRRNRKAE